MSWKQLKIRAESPKDYSPGQRPGYLYIYKDGALKEQKMKPRMLVASSFSLAEHHHTYSLLPKAVALGTCTYTRMALWKSKRWNLECFVASSFSLAERHHTYSLLPKAVALSYGLLDFQPMLLNSLYTPSLSHSLQMNLWVIHGNSCSKRFYPWITIN